jgi:glutamine synthetase/nicotinamidase-related amidase
VVGNTDYKRDVSFPRMIENAKRLIEAVRANRGVAGGGSEVIFTYLEALTDDSRDVSPDYKLSGKLLSNLPCPSHPATFVGGISPMYGKDIVMPKTSCSVFQSTNIHYVLRNLDVEQLVLCGQLTDQCVMSAARDAADLGYLVTVVGDACGAETEDDHVRGLRGMVGFARTMNTDDVLRELTRDGDGGGGNVHVHVPSADDGTAIDDDVDVVVPATVVPPPGPSSDRRRRVDDRGCQGAIVRSLRAAGVKFIRYAIVDAYNTVRCKAVPLPRASDRLLSDRVGGRDSYSGPLDDPVSIAEVCFAGLPRHADVPVSSANLSARNVLTLRPDLSSLRVLPYAPRTAMVMCTAHDQSTMEVSRLCTRGLLERVLSEAREGMGIEFGVGAELEFQLFRTETMGGCPRPIDSTTFANPATLNDQEDFISTLYDQLADQDIPIELVHAESAPGQLEVVLSYSNNVMQLADDVVLARETISSCAKKHGMKALFLPKTSTTTAGNGLHLHFSFKDVGPFSENSFSDPSQPSGISLRGQSFMEGILDHLPSLLSFTLPSVNSFRRVGPGCWTGSEVRWATEDKEAPIRVCLDLSTQHVTNVEYKLSDAMANIYLELSMILAAGMDGLKKGSKLRPPMYEGSETLPKSLQDSIDLLKTNHTLLSILGPQLSTAYLAVQESMAQIDKSIEEEVMDAFNNA